MRKKYLITIPALAAMLTCTSCNDWLDVMPDNRAEIDSSEKVYKLLVSAYPEISHVSGRIHMGFRGPITP